MKKQKKLDFKEILARLVQDTLFNGIRLECDKENNDKDWTDFIKAIKVGNPNLFEKMKGAEKRASKHGRYFAQFELWRDTIKINFAEEDPNNHYLRMSQGEGFNAVVKMNWYKSTGGELTTLDSWTNYDLNRVVLITATTGLIQNNMFTIKAPAYILAHNQSGLFIHDYGVLPVKEFLNKNELMFDDRTHDILADWYPARDLLELINEFLFSYVQDEMDLDTTRIIGNISYQDMHMRDKPSAKQVAEMFRNGAIFESEWYKNKTGSYSAGEEIKQKLILRTPGSDTKVDKMQSTFDGTKHIDAFMKMLNNAFEMCGYSWSKNDGDANYENTASVLNVNKTIYSTTKMKKIQRENDWYDFLKDIAHAYFKKIKGMSDIDAEFKAQEIKKYIKFEIISNMLNDYLKSDERTRENFQAGLMSLRKAVENINPDMSEEDVDQEVDNIKGEAKERTDSIMGGVENNLESDNSLENNNNEQSTEKKNENPQNENK